MNFELENKIALVTGGSKNIGKQIALSLASEKVNIAFTYNSSENQAEETLSEIKKFGVKVKAYKLDISNFNETSPMVVVIGAEDRGISLLAQKKCDFLLKIPLKGKTSSLNASVAAAISLFHLTSK